jgi:Protein of unknown function (DUF3696)
MKHLAHQCLQDSERAQIWPDSIGNVAIGPAESFIRFGGLRQADISLSEDGRKLGLGIQADGFGMTDDLDLPSLSSLWRVSSTVALPLSSEQDVGQRDIDRDPIYDHGHALAELLRYELRRKPGSLAATVQLRTVVEQTLSRLTLATQVSLKETEFDGKLKLSYSGTAIESEPTSPEQHGAGITAVLPLVIHMCASVSGEVLLAQDPEAHLHPHGQSLIGRELAKCAIRGVRVVVETHSEHVVNGIKLGLLEAGSNPADELACYYLSQEEGHSNVEAIVIDQRGLTRRWPTGFFDQSEIDLASLARQRNGA